MIASVKKESLQRVSFADYCDDYVFEKKTTVVFYTLRGRTLFDAATTINFNKQKTEKKQKKQEKTQC